MFWLTRCPGRVNISNPHLEISALSFLKKIEIYRCDQWENENGIANIFEIAIRRARNGVKFGTHMGTYRTYMV